MKTFIKSKMKVSTPVPPKARLTKLRKHYEAMKAFHASKGKNKFMM